MKPATLILFGAAFLLPAQEAVVPRDSLSIHLVQRGNMPLLESAEGSVTSLQPPRVVVNFPSTVAGRCEAGRSARVVVEAPTAIPGRVLQHSVEGPAGGCEVELLGPIPAGIGIGKSVGSLVEVADLKDVVFFGRPAGSTAGSTAIIFVLEPGTSFARRATVRYGKLSGPLIQVIDGLEAGDRVIVTDMSKWAAFPRVALR
jgi:HlyD family secretion protein